MEKAVRIKFYNGSNLNEAINVLQESKANCLIKPSENLANHYIYEGAKFIVYCQYRPYLISLHPFALYRVILHADETLKIVYSGAMIT